MRIGLVFFNVAGSILSLGIATQFTLRALDDMCPDQPSFDPYPPPYTQAHKPSLIDRGCQAMERHDLQRFMIGRNTASVLE